MEKQQKYSDAITYIRNLIGHETDAVSMMATIACVLKDAFQTFSWVGFYRVVGPELLKIGPYQGARGCIEISFERGVCGKCARERKTQIVPDVSAISYHIACSDNTKSEIVLPIFNLGNQLIAVLDIDSNNINNFDEVDKENLETICTFFSKIESDILGMF